MRFFVLALFFGIGVSCSLAFTLNWFNSTVDNEIEKNSADTHLDNASNSTEADYWYWRPFNYLRSAFQTENSTENNPASNTTSWTSRWTNITWINPFRMVSHWFSLRYENTWLAVGVKYLGSILSTQTGPEFKNSTRDEINDHRTVEARRADYFGYMSGNDMDRCISLMICEAGQSPDLYGMLGNRIGMFFRWYKPKYNDTIANWYKNVYFKGTVYNSTDYCRLDYPDCVRNMTTYAKYAIKKIRNELI